MIKNVGTNEAKKRLEGGGAGLKRLGWLEESDPAGYDFVKDRRSMAPCPLP